MSEAPIADRSLTDAELVKSVSPDTPDEHVQSVIVEPQAVADARLEFAKAVALGLSDTPPWLSSRFLYDDEGSRLFEEICKQPEYYPTRTEAGILKDFASKIRDTVGPVTLIELGSGNSEKTDHLLSAFTEGGESVRYVPVDVSEAILHQAKDAIVAKHPRVTVTGIADTYERAFPLFREFSPSMVMFLGSSIGNMDQRETDVFLGQVSENLNSGDRFLLGVDLVKDEAIINAAYNDAAGVTAQFTKNLFARINQELGAEIDLDQIEHVAMFYAEWQRVEIFARFLSDQEVYLAPLERSMHVEKGTMVMTEISRKYSLPKVQSFVRCFDFELEEVFTDDKKWFALLLLKKI